MKNNLEDKLINKIDFSTNPVSYRLIDFFISLNESVRKIEMDIGLANGTIGKINNGTIPGIDKIELIISKYSKLNTEWLFKGTGEMHVNAQVYAQVNAQVNAQVSEKDIKYNCPECINKNKEITQLKKDISLRDDMIDVYKERIGELKECIESKNSLIKVQEAEISRIINKDDTLFNQSCVS